MTFDELHTRIFPHRGEMAEIERALIDVAEAADAWESLRYPDRGRTGAGVWGCAADDLWAKVRILRDLMHPECEHEWQVGCRPMPGVIRHESEQPPYIQYANCKRCGERIELPKRGKP